MTRRPPSAGLSLVEVLVALAVFSVIGVAAFALLDQTLRSESIATARLTRLAALQRTMRVLSLDTLQEIAGTLQREDTGIRFQRLGRQDGAGVDGLIVRYALQDGNLMREIGPPGGDPARQTLLTDVAAVDWHLIRGGAPLPPDQPGGTAEAIELVLSLPGDQTLRGLFPVPHDTPVSP